MTLEQIEALDREFLIPKDIAPLLGCDPYYITLQARQDRETGKSSFPFPIIMIGNRTKIPKRAFVEVMKHGRMSNV